MLRYIMRNTIEKISIFYELYILVGRESKDLKKDIDKTVKKNDIEWADMKKEKLAQEITIPGV